MDFGTVQCFVLHSIQSPKLATIVDFSLVSICGRFFVARLSLSYYSAYCYCWIIWFYYYEDVFKHYTRTHMACNVAQGDLSIIKGILDNNMHVILIKTWSRVFKYICSIYFDRRLNLLMSLQRLKVSELVHYVSAIGRY